MARVNYALVQLMQGYWHSVPFGAELQRSAEERGHQYRRELYRRGAKGADVSSLLYWLPPDDHPMRPTALGNVLFAGEVRAGGRYGYWTEIVWPRLMPLLSDHIRGQLGDARNQLDAAARLCGLSLIGVLVTTIMLIPYDVCFLFRSAATSSHGLRTVPRWLRRDGLGRA